MPVTVRSRLAEVVGTSMTEAGTYCNINVAVGGEVGHGGRVRRRRTAVEQELLVLCRAEAAALVPDAEQALAIGERVHVVSGVHAHDEDGPRTRRCVRELEFLHVGADRGCGVVQSRLADVIGPCGGDPVHLAVMDADEQRPAVRVGECHQRLGRVGGADATRLAPPTPCSDVSLTPAEAATRR